MQFDDFHHEKLSGSGDASQIDGLSENNSATKSLPIIQECASVGYFFTEPDVGGVSYVAHWFVEIERIIESIGGDRARDFQTLSKDGRSRLFLQQNPDNLRQIFLEHRHNFIVKFVAQSNISAPMHLICQIEQIEKAGLEL